MTKQQVIEEGIALELEKQTITDPVCRRIINQRLSELRTIFSNNKMAYTQE